MAKHIFICKWKRTGNQWRIWVKGKPKLSGQGETLESAQIELEQAIWNDAENVDDVIPTVMEFDPPLPASERTKKFFMPEIYMIYGDGRFDLLRWMGPYADMDAATMEYMNSLYENGICKTCKYGIGKRTVVEFKAEDLEGGYDGLWLFHSQIHAKAYFFSDRFISLLTDEERRHLKFRECTVKRKRKREFYELAGNSIAANVGVKGFDANGRECTECGHRHFWVTETDLEDHLQIFLCRSDLPDPLTSCFAISVNGQISLCMTKERWDCIRGDKNAKGIISERIAVIDEAGCERHPRLQTSFKECDTCSKWNNPKEKRFWKLPASGNDIRNHPSIIWLKNEVKKPEVITVVRQEDTIDHLIEMAESGERIKESKTISFHCPDCWRLGRLFISPTQFGMAW